MGDYFLQARSSLCPKFVCFECVKVSSATKSAAASDPRARSRKRPSSSEDGLRPHDDASIRGQNLGYGYSGNICRSACNAGGIDTFHDVVIALSRLGSAVHISSLVDDRRIQLHERKCVARRSVDVIAGHRVGRTRRRTPSQVNLAWSSRGSRLSGSTQTDYSIAIC